MRRVAVVIAVLSLAFLAGWHRRSRTSDWVTPATHAHGSVQPQLPNAAVLGQPTSEPSQLLRDKQAGEAEPITIRIDPRCGRYAAMDVLYPPEVSEAAVKLAVSTLYGSEIVTPSGTPSGRWQWPAASPRLSILVTIEREGFNKGHVHVFFSGSDPCATLDNVPPKDS